MAQGYAVKDIAKKIGISSSHVHQEKFKAYMWSGVKTGPEYVYKLLKEGIIA
jgi:DNA-binding NarL/FixJ family response regulator